MAQRLAPVHELLVERLGPRPGERWLDVATGTGEVAIRAAAAGADVTGIDIAPGVIAEARAKAPALRFELADVQALPFPDGSFDVVSSVFGAMLAPDHDATARELARVCSGRIALTAWERNEWGREEYVRAKLGAAFDLEFERCVWQLGAVQRPYLLVTGGKR